ncbi:hypothetical protein Q427_03035 [Halomonas sp. BC04]|nr:hypothetical protein Q427_03035 [Halomonas sp. BC04]
MPAVPNPVFPDKTLQIDQFMTHINIPADLLPIR